MVEIRRTTYSVTTTGVGRADYSKNVEQSVEPLIRSYQSEYNYNNTVNIGPGAEQIVEVSLPSGYVVLIYDFYVTNPNNVLVGVIMEFLTATGAWYFFTAKQDMITVSINLAKGWPVFNKYRFRITNNGLGAADFDISAHGIKTAETEYYGSVVVSPLPSP